MRIMIYLPENFGLLFDEADAKTRALFDMHLKYEHDPDFDVVYEDSTYCILKTKLAGIAFLVPVDAINGYDERRVRLTLLAESTPDMKYALNARDIWTLAQGRSIACGYNEKHRALWGEDAAVILAIRKMIYDNFEAAEADFKRLRRDYCAKKTDLLIQLDNFTKNIPVGLRNNPEFIQSAKDHFNSELDRFIAEFANPVLQAGMLCTPNLDDIVRLVNELPAVIDYNKNINELDARAAIHVSSGLSEFNPPLITHATGLRFFGQQNEVPEFASNHCCTIS